MGRNLLIGLIVLYCFCFLVPKTVSKAEALNCKNEKPFTPPILISAIPIHESVKLTWTEGQGPLTHYLVAYGRSPDVIEYGNPNIGGPGTTSYTVSQLSNGMKYYFKVRAVNGCKPGKFSNKLSAIPGNIPYKISSKTPNLSLYKLETETSTATPKLELENPKPVPITTVLVKSTKCVTCSGWKLLAVETIFLILYLSLAVKVPFFKKIFSIIIPITTYFLFIKMNGSCSINIFSCKYFLQLNIIIFMTCIILYKNRRVVFFKHILKKKGK